MALFLRQEDGRSKLQQQIAAELQAKAKAKTEAESQPDGVDDSRFIENTEHAHKFAWIWIIVFLVVIVFLVWLIVQTFA